jgi:intraflagellar transport protein 172
LIWPINRPNELYFGVAEGKIKLGMLKSNSAQILYSTDSYVVTMCCSQDGKLIFSGHVDNSIFKYNMETCSATKFINFTSVPYCLSCGIQNHILVAGNDCKVIFYSDMGEKLQNFDYSHDEKLKDFTLSRVNSAYDSIAVGNFDKFFIFMYNSKKSQWEEVCIKNVENYYTVTALCWKPEVNTLVTGSLCGSIDIFESCLKKSLYGDKYEITYISHYQVTVKDLESGRRITIKSIFSNEITKLNIQNENFVTINTKDSLIVADLTTGKSSEIQGNFSGNEKYDYSNPNVCMIYQLGEITIIEYGNNEIIGYFRTEYVHPNLISARIYSQGQGDQNTMKVIAYLIDPYTIYIQDLVTQNLIISLSHESPIEFLDLNRNGSKLLFRDNKRHLYLYLIQENKKVTLLNFCGFVQWVPGTEVLVAQDRKNMIVWYNIDDLDNFKTISIKGDIEEVKRQSDQTEVLVDEGGDTKIYLLEEKLISLSIAIEQGDLNRAMAILENLSNNSNQGVPSPSGSNTHSSETDVYWKALARTALQKKNLLITQRCFAALGAYSKANYIKKIMKDVDSLGADHPIVEAKLLILDKQFLSAESLLLNNKLVSEAISIFNEIHRFEESVKIAEKYNIPEYKDIQNKYYNWLIENELFDKAAEVKIKEGNFMDAIKLYIQGDLYIKASNLITREKLATGVESHIIDFLVTSMTEIGVFEKAAELLEYTKEYEKAIELYIKANCFPKALELSRNYLNKEKNKNIEELWGDYLTAQRQVEQSVGHYIDAGRYDKAIEALINSRKWEKASELCEEVISKNITPSIPLENFFTQIGEHYLKEKNFDLAEKFFIKAKNFENLIEIFIKNKKWERLESFIEKYSHNVTDNEKVKNILIELAIKYEKDSVNPKYKEAEKLYIYANEPDLAITMYKNLRNFEEMVKLVEIHMPDYLSATLTMIAQLCEEENSFKIAEKYYTYGESPDWNSCLDMYYKNNMIEDCIRVAEKYSPNEDEFLNICQGIFKDNPHEGKDILLKLNMIDHCIKFLCFVENFEEANNLAQSKCKEMIPYVNFKYGLFLKINKNFEKAEECLIKAKKFKEIINMYLEIEDFNNSLRVCRKYCEDLIPEIYFRQGSFYLKKFEIDKAEICFSKTNKPEVFFEFLLENNYRDRAITYAERYAPHLLNNQNKNDYMKDLMENIEDNKIRYVISRCIELENSKNYQEAIEAYLQLHQQEIKNKSHLIIIYQKVLELCKFTDKDYKKKVFEVLVRKYLSLEEYKKAADLLKHIQNYEEAMTCYIMGNEIREAENMIHEIDDASEREILLKKLNNKIKTGK